MDMQVELKGMDDVEKLLGTIAPNEAQNIMRATIYSVAGGIRDDAKARMPFDEGTMIAGTKVKREKVRHGFASSTVRVAGAFYWRFLEYGQGPAGVQYAMFGKAVDNYRARQNQIMLTEFGKKFEAALARARKRQSNG